MASPKVEAMVSSWSDTLASRFASLRGPDPAYAPGAHYMERYDMASFGGRLLFFLDITSPDHLFFGAADLDDARATLREGAPKHGDADLWRAARALHAKTTADGAPIPEPCRVGGWACFGSVPVSALILTAKYAPTSLPLFAAGHWLNQSHLASVSYFNRPPGKPAPLWRLGSAYCAAIGSAIGVFLAWKRVVVRFPALAGLGIFAPYPAAAGANMVNTVVMRFQELEDGVEVFDDRGAVVGVSHVAARSAVFDTCVTRLALPAGNFILTPLAYLALERGTPLGRAVARRPWLALPTQLATTVACFALCVPGSLALYPPVVAVPAADLEPHIASNFPDGTILRYNKGM